MSVEKKITPKVQFQPEAARAIFMKGVLAEAVQQGYGVEAQGRLLVVALRAWEGR